MFFIIDTKDKRAEAATAVSRLPASPRYSVEIKPYKRNRSLAQNRTMWMWYAVIADHMGCEPEDLHEEMKVRVLGVERKIVAGQACIIPKSSTTLDVDGMGRFMAAIESLAADLEVKLPATDEYDYAMHGKRAA
ncbi:recombination protein NinB [Mesorhizobium sp. BR-1-1-10]|uniref:recombination protein NinB n=1 Tax=Mesorhizobium sp. BR-1-1-10 TaxID=2876660 RepID=UPI001CD09FDE|nr:recombination protein NinB [Mesorhizobium sp. BR-1-1-10]MBZ9975505.1 recombination protein NinB [Mesorhizobium sp. BR-1-1-10]